MTDSSRPGSEQHIDISKSNGFPFPKTEKHLHFTTGSFN